MRINWRLVLQEASIREFAGWRLEWIWKMRWSLCCTKRVSDLALPCGFLVRTREVSVCLPFWPRSLEFGMPWDYFDQPADFWLDEHWRKSNPLLYSKAGLSEQIHQGFATNR
jgi:hypothetical protein